MATLAPMNRARKPCSTQWGALRRFVTRKSTSKLTNQAHAPQSAAAARTLCLLATLSTLPFPEFFTFKAAQLARRQRFFLFRQSSPYRIGGQTDKVARRHKVLAAAALWGACA